MIRCRQLSSVARLAEKVNYQPVIGLEIHVQLNTKTKLFSRAPNGMVDGIAPNRCVAPLDMAHPGILPKLNRQCVMHAIKMAELLECRVNRVSRFDRKHYFYADMPAGYQITQQDEPIAVDGRFGCHVMDETIEPYWKEIDIARLQLEQDSGKTIHIDRQSLIDYNRAGSALVEIVTTPCLSTALEAVCFVQQLRLVLMHYGLCDGELHKGHMRVDANVSLKHDGIDGTRTEIKNMNSLKCVHTAVNYEIARQYEILSKGGVVLNETRAADAEGRTVSMRDKEEETDYRFMREPNLPALKIKEEWIESCSKEIKDTKKPLFIRYRDIGFDPRTAVYFAEDPLLSNFVGRCLQSDISVEPDSIRYWLKELKTIMQRSKATYPPHSDSFAQKFMKLIHYYETHRITRLVMLELLRFYSSEEDTAPSVDEMIDENEYWRITDDKKIEEMCSTCLTMKPDWAEKAKKGNNKVFNKIRNLIIERSKKCIDVVDIEKTLKRLIQ